MKKDFGGQKVLELVEVPDGKVDFDATRNLVEVEAVIKKLHEIVIEDERKNPDKPISIGIISPFRAQVEQLKTSVSKVLSDHMIKKHQIEIGTAHTFQGDERDIILMSWAFANNSHAQSATFLQKSNLFNVAITRARHKVINFVSRDITNLPEGHFRSYISYIKEYQNKQQALENLEIDENDVLKYENKLKEIIKSDVDYFFRPPEGLFNKTSLNYIKQLGYNTIFWSVAYKDWDTNNQNGMDKAVNSVIKNLHNGAIILLHSVSKDNVKALPVIIDKIKEEGYEIKTLYNLFNS